MQASLSEKSAWSIYKRLLSYVKPLSMFFVVSVIGYVIYAVSNVLYSKIMEHLVIAVESENSADKYLVPLEIIAVTVLRGIGAFLGAYYIAKVANTIVHRLRVDVFNHMTTIPNQSFDEKPSGHLVSLITYNINGVTAAATDAIKIGLREGATVIGLFSYLLYLEWKLTLMFVCVAPLIGLLVTRVGKRLRRLSNKVQTSVGDITQITSEMVNGFGVMRSFGGEAYEKNRFESISKKNYLQNMKIALTAAANTPLLQLLIAFSMAFLIFWVLNFTKLDNTAEFMGYMTALGMMLQPMRRLGEITPMILKGVAAADSVFQMLDTPAEKDQGHYQVEKVKGDVEFSNVSFTYPNKERPALKNFKLQINAGEVIALVGASGSGKSTLVNLLNRFYDPSEGEILIDGVPIEQYRLQNLRQQIALVNQQVTLFNETVAANIAYGSQQDPDMDAIKASADAAYATEFIQTLPEGFATPIGESGGRLSGGQRQRLVIARALFKDAPILILDEATAALDNESEHYIQQALVRVMKGRTTIVIAHRLSTIENADRILVMADGQIVEEGSHQELLAKQGHYTRLYEAKFEV
jgi:subfamily B ATP-binding cassette protein MsbA